MADTKITNLASATAATGQEIPVNTAGTDNKITVGAILNLLNQGNYTGNIGTSGAPIGDIYLAATTGAGRIFKGADTRAGLLTRVIVQSTSTTAGVTYDPPDGVAFVIVECVGGGGGGAGSALSGAGSGGGAGGYCKRLIPAATLGTGALALVLGTGGAASTTAGAGNAGVSTTFGALMTACGGQGGATGAVTPPAGGVGGAATSGDINITGGSGGAGFITGLSSALPKAVGGYGGTGVYGAGGRMVAGVTAAIVPGVAGTGFGAGGGGGATTCAASGTAGGAGTGGIIIIWEYV
jgi:hypothetical protein